MAKFDRPFYEERFITHLRKRLNEGDIQHGNANFALPLEDIIVEIQEELADVAGWAFIGWTKLERLREKIDGCGIEDLAAPHEES